MILKEYLDLRKSLPYVRHELALAAATSTTVYGLHVVAGLETVALPNILPGVLGTALAIFLGFRNSAAYSRWGEAAQLWASISNYSRIFARLILTFVEAHKHTPQYELDEARAYQQEMIYRHLAWVNALRLQLREHPDETVGKVLQPFLTDQDWDTIAARPDKPTAIMTLQGHRIYDAMRSGVLQGFDSFQLENCLAQLANYQAQCERIKTIPIPRQYTFFTRFFVWVFISLVPLSFIETFVSANQGWLIMPVTVLIAYVFGIVERTGDVNEYPFENRITDVPLSAYCTEIERDLRLMLEEVNVPAKPVPIEGYLF